MMDTKFSVALHILTMISESKEVLSSQALAESVGTDASYIRKVIALLKKCRTYHFATRAIRITVKLIKKRILSCCSYQKSKNWRRADNR